MALYACILLSPVQRLFAQAFQLQTQYARISVDNKGFVTSIKDKGTGREYCPAGMSSALMSLQSNKQEILPQKAVYNAAGKEIVLTYANGSVARIKAEQKTQYLRFQLLALTKSDDIDNIVWGPYKTNISKTIGDVIGVVRNDDFAIGLLGLDDNTTSGPPTGGDLSFMYYYIHSPDPKKYPLPAHLKEGQTFSIGGDGVNDVAFYSNPEEYFRMNYGNGAKLEPAFGSTICMHARDRRKEQMIRFPEYPDNIDGKANSSRYQLVLPTNAQFIGSSLAFYACPDSLGLKTIEKVVLNEGLPHPMIDGKWIKDPAAYRPDIAWWGPHDSLASYAKQLGIKGIQDEGWGEYYPNPANRFTNRQIGFKSSSMSIPDYGALMQQNGLRYGLHTLCEFLQPGSSDVSPVPSDSLGIMQRTFITKDLSPDDTVITVTDTAYFNEFGGWEGNHTNVLKIGKELIEYNGITTTPPYTFLKIKRGFHRSVRGTYKAGTMIVKLQPNCYRGFVPDMNLQEVYADYYGKWLTEGKMDYIDFDGLESCMYQGHGQYSFKRFFRGLFDSYTRNGGRYLRVMGSAVYEGSWHYMSVCNVGGGDNMFSPVLNKWGIEGKDMRYVFEGSYFPATFGIQGLQTGWTVYDIENLQAKSIGWNATYMLGISQGTLEKCANKQALIDAFRTWEDARVAQLFTKAQKEKLKDLSHKFHLTRIKSKVYLLSPVQENRYRNQPLVKAAQPLELNNEFDAQPLDLTIRIDAPKEAHADGLKITVDGAVITIDRKLMPGQQLIYQNNRLYLADAGRNKLEEFPVTKKLNLPKGRSTITVEVLGQQDDKIKFELVVAAIGKGEKIGK
ncbi:hypothetical protein A3860_23605 [Niastella vici]|uniref:Uncharacterized protein n=2 Tax=Niastella vici TaxID=1703345 RepID=A0A1V9G069_9BACT|nr:hypothetical protein A3860_23605 [Niastella vici]